jgi:hypothetical protein
MPTYILITYLFLLHLLLLSKVYLCGRDNYEHAKKLLNGTGAIRLDRLTDTVSHIVVLGAKIPDKDKETLKTLDQM